VSQPDPAQRLIVVSAAECAPNTRRGGDLRTMLSPKTVGSTSGFMGMATVAAGDFVASHRHPYSEEFIVLVSGALLVQAGDEELELRPGQGLMVPTNVPHRLVNTAAREAQLVFHISPLAPRPDLGHVDLEEHAPAGAVAADGTRP
jgi:putative monooxygenase